MANVEIVKWWNGDIKYGENIRTHRTNSYSSDKGTQCDNYPFYSLWRYCKHLHVPLVLYLPFPMGGSFKNWLFSCFCYDQYLFTLLCIPLYYFPPLLWEPFFMSGFCHNFLVIMTENFNATVLIPQTGKQLVQA